jgi:uncharacterized membrane protein YfhO
MFNPTWAFVAALYAVAIALARRGGIDIPRRIAVLFYLLVFVFLYLPLTQDFVSLPVDFLKQLPPWAYVTPNHDVQNSQLNDLPLQIVPWAHQVRESWKAFEAPLWNHLSASGYPLLGSAQSSALSVLRILALPLELGHAMTAEAAMKILIALTFTFLLCRRRGYSELASTTGAVAFGFSTFIVVWLHFPLITSACLLPAVLYALDLLIERRTYARFVFAAIVWTLMLFGGHPETASHTFFISVMTLVWVVLVERHRQPVRLLGTLVVAMIVAGLLAAPFLAPFAEGLTRSKRYHELKANPPGAEVPYSDWPSAIVVLQPHFFGEVPHEKSWGPTDAESMTGFAGYLGVAAWFIVLANVIATRAWRSREMFFVVMTLIVTGVILAWPGFSETFHFAFRLAANARLRLLLVLLLALQTAAAVDLLQRGKKREVLIGIGAASALLLYAFGTWHFDTPYERQSALQAMLPSIAILVIAATAAFLRRRIAVLALLVAVIAELWEVGRGWNPVVPSSLMYPKTPILERLAQLKSEQPKNRPFRIVGTGPMFFPNASAIYGFEDIRAHDPMANGNYLGVLRVVADYDPSDYFAKWNDVNTRLLDYLNVRYVLTSPRAELDPYRYSLLYDGADGRIFENVDVLPRFYPVRNVFLEFRRTEFARQIKGFDAYWSSALLDELPVENDQMRTDLLSPRAQDAPIASTEIVEAAPTDYRVHVKAPRYTLIVSSIPWWPGWKVLRSGTRITPLRVNGAFLGFAVPPGEVDVRIWYEPISYRVGWILAGLTVIALVALKLSGISGSVFREPAYPPESSAGE